MDNSFSGIDQLICEVQEQQIQIQPNDVLSGKGKQSYCHPGNVDFRNQIKKHRNAYKACTGCHDRLLLVEEVIDTMQTVNGSRFLRRNHSSDKWMLMNPRQIQDKVSNAFRDSVKRISSTTNAVSVRRTKSINGPVAMEKGTVHHNQSSLILKPPSSIGHLLNSTLGNNNNNNDNENDGLSFIDDDQLHNPKGMECLQTPLMQTSDVARLPTYEINHQTQLLYEPINSRQTNVVDWGYSMSHGMMTMFSSSLLPSNNTTESRTTNTTILDKQSDDETTGSNTTKKPAAK